MLASAETIDAVAAALIRHGRLTCVVDPVQDHRKVNRRYDLTPVGHGRNQRCSATPGRSSL